MPPDREPAEPPGRLDRLAGPGQAGQRLRMRRPQQPDAAFGRGRDPVPLVLRWRPGPARTAPTPAPPARATWPARTAARSAAAGRPRRTHRRRAGSRAGLAARGPRSSPASRPAPWPGPRRPGSGRCLPGCSTRRRRRRTRPGRRARRRAAGTGCGSAARHRPGAGRPTGSARDRRRCRCPRTPSTASRAPAGRAGRWRWPAARTAPRRPARSAPPSRRRSTPPTPCRARSGRPASSSADAAAASTATGWPRPARPRWTGRRPRGAPAGTGRRPCRASEPPLQSSTTSSGGAPRPAACRRSPVAMNAVHSRSSRVVLPVPVVPTTTWCDRIRR